MNITQTQKRVAAASAVLFLSLSIWSFFLSASGFSIKTAIGIEGFPLVIQKLTSISFIIFAIFFPLSIALVACYAKVFERKQLYAIIISAFAVFALTAFLAFGKIFEFWIPGVALFGSMFIVAEAAFIKFGELKAIPFARVALGAIGQANLIIGIALFASTALFVFPIQKEVVSGIENEMLGSIVNQNFNQGLSGTAASLYVQGQKDLAGQLLASPQFALIENKQDLEVQAFVLTAKAAGALINSPQYLETVKSEVDKKSESELTTDKIREKFDEIKSQIPLVKVFEELFYLMAAMLVFSFYSVLGNFVFKPLGAGFGLLIGLFLQNLEKPLTP